MRLSKSELSRIIDTEIKFSTSRSGGPGGQHVNKVNTKVTLKWDIPNSDALSEEQKAVALKKLKSRCSSEGILLLNSQSGRTQLQNKHAVVLKLEDLLLKAFETRKKRIPTMPTKASINKRLLEKKIQGEKKRLRKGLE